MRCTNCQSQQMVKMALIANKYDKKSEKGINAYLCEECGHIDLWLEDNKNE